jgi:hypothetical protein
MFKPPPNDPYGITAEDLKIALRGCMAATPLFSKMAIPLFWEVAECDVKEVLLVSSIMKG